MMKLFPMISDESNFFCGKPTSLSAKPKKTLKPELRKKSFEFKKIRKLPKNFPENCEISLHVILHIKAFNIALLIKS